MGICAIAVAVFLALLTPVNAQSRIKLEPRSDDAAIEHKVTTTILDEIKQQKHLVVTDSNYTVCIRFIATPIDLGKDIVGVALAMVAIGPSSGNRDLVHFSSQIVSLANLEASARAETRAILTKKSDGRE